MKAHTVFRTLILVQALFVLSIVLFPGLDLEIQHYFGELTTALVWKPSGNLMSERIYTVAVVSSIVMTVAMATFVAGLIGAYFYKIWGRNLLVITAVMSLIPDNIFKLIADFPTHSMCQEATAAVFYVALTMSFLPPVADNFKAKCNA